MSPSALLQRDALFSVSFLPAREGRILCDVPTKVGNKEQQAQVWMIPTSRAADASSRRHVPRAPQGCILAAGHPPAPALCTHFTSLP